MSLIKANLVFCAITLLNSLVATSISKNCYKYFKEDYQLFFFSDDSEIELNPPTKKSYFSNYSMKGTFTLSVCGSIDVPSDCSSTTKKAKLIYKEGDTCVIIPENTNWNYQIETNNDVQTIQVSSKGDNKPILIYNFICQKGNSVPEIKLNSASRNNEFHIDISSSAGCGIKLEFMKTLDEFPYVTAISFTLMGVVFCFFGLKFYKDLLGVFISLIILIAGVYIYMYFVEKSTLSDGRPILIIAIIFGLMVVVALTMFISNIIIAIICAIASYSLGKILYHSLESKFDFLNHEYGEWISIITLFIVMYFAYLCFKDYLIIINTAAIGSFSIIIALHYYGLLKLNILFDMHADESDSSGEINPDSIRLPIIYGLLVLLGISVQMYLYKHKIEAKEESKDIKIALKINQ